MTQFVNDTFSDTNGTLLTAHTAGGANWAKVTSPPASVPTINSNRVAGNNATTAYGIWTADNTPPSADYFVEGVIHCNTLQGGSAGFAARMSGSATGYVVLYDVASTQWQLYRSVSGSFTAIGTNYTQSLSAATSYTVRIEVSGTGATVTITVYVDGVSRITYSDTNANRITAANKVGVWFNVTSGATQGLSIDSIVGDDAAPAAATGTSLTGPSSGTVSVASTNCTVGVTPIGGTITGTVRFTPNDGGAGGTFSPTYLDLTTGSPSGTFTYAPSTVGARTITVTNNSGGAIASSSGWTYTSNAAAAPTSGAASFTSATNTTINVTCTAASGGTAPLTYQWYRDTVANFTPGAGNLLSGATSLSLADSASLAADAVYYYKCRVTDNAAQTATSNQVAGALMAAPLIIGLLGDSITKGTAGPAPAAVTVSTRLQARLQSMYKQRAVTVVNQGVNGASAQEWAANTGSIFSTAKTAFASAGCTHIMVMLGSNDAADHRSAAQYLADMQTIIGPGAGSLVTAGYTVIVNYPTYVPAGANSGATDETATEYLRSYLAQIDALVNGTTILRGDTLAYSYFVDHPSEVQADQTHLLDAGNLSLASMWARAVDRAVLQVTNVVSPLAAQTVTVTLVNESDAAQASLSSLKWAWWDQATPNLALAPTCSGTAETTDGSGVLSIAIQTSLGSGDVGWLVVTNSDGTPTQSPAHRAFSGPVAVA